MKQLTPQPRLRLAPSPTGFFHLGNFRTALFTYLLARRWQGMFIVRIEDTDRERFVEGSVERLFSVLDAFHLGIDEGPGRGGAFGPYVQSERLGLYRQHAETLVEAGKAYYCFCTAEELETMRREQIEQKLPPRYDRRWREAPAAEIRRRLEAGEAHVIRHKMPLDGEIAVRDELRGEIVFAAAELDDYVLLKSDGWPTYQLASVVDDHAMEITHVTRGVEWIPSLPKNITLYRDFGWKPPRFIHLPLILNKTGGKLSKRQGDVFVEDFLAKGYLPEALVNYTVLLGWHPKDDREIFSLSELQDVFDLDGIGTSPAVFDSDKLDYFNGVYIRSLSAEELLERARPFLKDLLAALAAKKQTDDFLTQAIALEQSRLVRLDQLAERLEYLFAERLEYDPSLLSWKGMEASKITENLTFMSALLADIPQADWTAPTLETAVIGRLKAETKPLGDYLWPVRVALSGKKASPGPLEIAAVLKKEETLDKIRQALGKLS